MGGIKQVFKYRLKVSRFLGYLILCFIYYWIRIFSVYNINNNNSDNTVPCSWKIGNNISCLSTA